MNGNVIAHTTTSSSSHDHPLVEDARSVLLVEPSMRGTPAPEPIRESAAFSPKLASERPGPCPCWYSNSCSLRCCSWTSSNPHSQSGFSLKRLAGAYVLYFALGSVIFKLASVQQWNWPQSVYFAMTTGLSIGYGAMQPSSTLCKAFAIFYVTLGACALTLLLSVFVRKLLNLVPLIAAEEWKFQVDAKTRQSTARALLSLRSSVAPKYRVEIVLWLALVCWALLGTIWAREWQERLNDKPQWTWLTSAFFAVGTITTTGMIGPEVDEQGQVPSKSAVFLAIYAIVGVPLFGAAISHRASTYVEAQVRRQERENLGNRLSNDLVNAVQELRYGAAVGHRSARTSMMAVAAEEARLSVPDASRRQAKLSPPNCDESYDSAAMHVAPRNVIMTRQAAERGLRPTISPTLDGDHRNDSDTTFAPTLADAQGALLFGEGRPSDEQRVEWADFLALQLLRLRKVDFALLKDLKHDYLEMIATSQHNSLCWSMLTTPGDEEISRSPNRLLNSEMEAQAQASC